MIVTLTNENLPYLVNLSKKASTKLLFEWAVMKYPGARAFYELRLGPTRRTAPGVQLTPALEAALRVNNWFADLVVPTPTQIDVIEAKVEPSSEALGQVLWYARLAPGTPDLAVYAALPVQPVTVFGEHDDMLFAFIRSFGIRTELYVPLWLADWMVRRQVQHGRTNAA